MSPWSLIAWALALVTLYEGAVVAVVVASVERLAMVLGFVALGLAPLRRPWPPRLPFSPWASELGSLRASALVPS